MLRFCKRFYCDERHERICCADCFLRRDCANPCLNHPTRCGLEDKDHVPGRPRGRPRKKTPEE